MGNWQNCGEPGHAVNKSPANITLCKTIREPFCFHYTGARDDLANGRIDKPTDWM